METKILNVNPKELQKSKIEAAARIIKNGGLVAFPTETVYGLGANGLNRKAVKKIFEAKGRPQDNPLILHVSNMSEAKELVYKIPSKAKELIKSFWPGPLTIVLKKSKKVPDRVTAGLDSVAVRMPKNNIALELIKESGCPLAAPSANLSGKPSPTRAIHVADDLDGKIGAIIDGGEVDIGLESTVVDLTEKIPKILRPGKITRREIEKIVGETKLKKSSADKPRSPGMKHRHYSPEAKVIIIKNGEGEIFDKYPHKKIKILEYKNETSMAKNLFKDFREADKENYEIIAVRGVKDEGLGGAIMDRLRKAGEN